MFCSNNASELLSADVMFCSGLSEAWDLVDQLAEKAVYLNKRFSVGGRHVAALPQTLRFGECFNGPMEKIDKSWPNPLPDWSIFSKDYLKHSSFTVMTSRGCPYKCKFCSSSAFWGTYIPLPVERVIAEIKQLAELGAKKIIIFDDLFTANVERLRQIAQRIIAEGLHTIEYNCLVRADNISYEALDLLRLMNVTGAAFGAESGSNKMLKSMNKKSTKEINQECINKMLSYSYSPVFSMVVGFPGENKATLHDSLSFIENNKSSCLCEVYPVQPLPGTWLWDYFINKYSPDLNTFQWDSLRIRGNVVDWDRYNILSDDCSKDDLRDFFNAFNSIYSTSTIKNSKEIHSAKLKRAFSLKDIFKRLRGA